MAELKRPDKVPADAISRLFSAKWARFPIKVHPYPETIQSFPNIIPSEILFGIEFEIENAEELPMEFADYFTCANDGSLRNNGRELKYCGKGEALARALRFYFQRLPKQIEFSPRTSIHVHVDCRNMTTDRIFSMMVLSLMYENLFYSFCGNERQSSAFCVPMPRTSIPIQMRKLFSQFGFNTPKWDSGQCLLTSLQVWSKYLGTNILPLSSFGTIEFRQMKGHRDEDHLINWLNILGMMKISTAKTAFGDLIPSILELNTNSEYDIFTRRVFGKAAAPLIRLPDFEKHMEAGVIAAKHMFSPIEKIMEFMRSVKEDSSYYATFPEDAEDKIVVQKNKKHFFDDLVVGNQRAEQVERIEIEMGPNGPRAVMVEEPVNYGGGGGGGRNINYDVGPANIPDEAHREYRIKRERHKELIEIANMRFFSPEEDQEYQQLNNWLLERGFL